MGHFFVVSEIVTQAFSIYPFLGGRGLWAGRIPLLLHTIINRAAKARGRKGKRIVFEFGQMSMIRHYISYIYHLLSKRVNISYRRRKMLLYLVV